jgi:hypothetical protein
MDKEYILILVITFAIWFFIQDAKADDTVTILQPDGNIQICTVGDNGVVICL